MDSGPALTVVRLGSGAMRGDRWLEMHTLGMWQANCYLLGDAEHGTAVVVDPGQDATALVTQRLAAREATCEAILLTHGHLDHLWSAPELARQLDVPIYLHPEDRWIFNDPGAGFGNLPAGALETQFGLVWDPPTERLAPFADGDLLRAAGFAITARHTPGHTPGSSVFLVDDEALLLSGDLVFAGSVGRTDFPRGSWQEQMDAISRVVLPLDDAVEIHSGHGPATTVGAERTTNPFLADLR